MNSKLLKEAIADAKAVRETALANAKIALEEAFTPKLQSMLSKKLKEELEGEEEEEAPVADPVAEEGEEPVAAPAEEAPVTEEDELDLDEILREMGYGDDEEVKEEEEAPVAAPAEDDVLEIEDDNAENLSQLKQEVEEKEEELKEAYNVIKSLKGTINEVNLLNAKLLYVNKLFRSYNLTNEQKSKVVETLDRTKNVREVKLVYSTIAESFKIGTGVSKKSVNKLTEGYASKVAKSTAPAKKIITENTFADRFKKLAGINKY